MLKALKDLYISSFIIYYLFLYNIRLLYFVAKVKKTSYFF